VLISYPEDVFHNPKALHAFLYTDVSLTTGEIHDAYVKHRPIKLFFISQMESLPLVNTEYGLHRKSKGNVSCLSISV